MSHRVIDPKEVLKQIKAKKELDELLREKEMDVKNYLISKRYDTVTILLKNGDMITGKVMLVSSDTLMYDPGQHPFKAIPLSSIALVE